ncbi:unnamed protein product [Arabis nemorensis]|uniref:Uncharacterized protein n=1 Tax=Arabis nemorensis TaxID=586526 RepID=A0A565CBF3_9BRAS|nr:unnamed protein product [Arabis nemorensis]
MEVPDCLYSEKGLMFLGDIIRESKKLHPSTERCIRLDVARILVVVNLEKPLPSKIDLSDEQETLISVSYLCLPSRCQTCQA